MHKILKQTRAETIAEIMIALIIILLAVTTAFKTLAIAFSQKNLTQDKVIAINLAREGMEAVRYIRDYNWLYYGSKPRVCWNHLQDFNNDGRINNDENSNGTPDESADYCSENSSNGFPDHQIGSHNGISPDIPPPSEQAMEYVLSRKDTHWFLTRCADIAPPIAPSLVTCADTTAVGSWASVTADKMFTIEGRYTDGTTNDLGSISSNADNISKGFQICKDASSGSTENQVTNALYTPCVESANLMRTKFFRYVKIEYINNPQDTNPDGVLTKGQEQNMMRVLVGVKWLDGEAVQDVELVTVLSDFYGRTYNDTQN